MYVDVDVDVDVYMYMLSLQAGSHVRCGPLYDSHDSVVQSAL